MRMVNIPRWKASGKTQRDSQCKGLEDGLRAIAPCPSVEVFEVDVISGVGDCWRESQKESQKTPQAQWQEISGGLSFLGGGSRREPGPLAGGASETGCAGDLAGVLAAQEPLLPE